MKNTYWEIPEKIKEALEDSLIYVGTIKDNPSAERYLKNTKSILETISDVEEKNKTEYSILDVLQHFTSLKEFEEKIE